MLETSPVPRLALPPLILAKTRFVFMEEQDATLSRSTETLDGGAPARRGGGPARGRPSYQ